jgi:hypothetical protein
MMRRRTINSRDPIAQAMWAEGRGINEIARALGKSSHNHASTFGAIDPTPQPLGCPPGAGLAGETDEARVWRRFPLTTHKPGN